MVATRTDLKGRVLKSALRESSTVRMVIVFAKKFVLLVEAGLRPASRITNVNGTEILVLTIKRSYRTTRENDSTPEADVVKLGEGRGREVDGAGKGEMRILRGAGTARPVMSFLVMI